MKIAIIGCGAMGSVYAGLLADSGNNVLVVDSWQGVDSGAPAATHVLLGN